MFFNYILDWIKSQSAIRKVNSEYETEIDNYGSNIKPSVYIGILPTMSVLNAKIS